MKYWLSQSFFYEGYNYSNLKVRFITSCCLLLDNGAVENTEVSEGEPERHCN